MQQIFISLVEQLNSAVFLLFLILIATLCCIFIFAKWLGKHEEKESGFAKRMDRVEEKLDDVKDKLSDLGGRVKLIYDNTLSPDKRMTASSSPIALTENGQKAANKLKAKDIIDRIYNQVKSDIETKNEDVFEKNAYDIQQIIFTYFSNNIETYLNAEELNSFKTEAYTQGTIVEDLYKILAVIFRDKLFKELRKPVSDIDKHDPKI